MTEKERQEAELKKKISVKMFFTGIVALTIVLLVVANTLGWFTQNSSANVDDVGVRMGEPSNLYIADDIVGEGVLRKYLHVDYFPLYAICGNGNKFFKPEYGSVLTSSSAQFQTYSTVVTSCTEMTEQELKSSALVRNFYLTSDSADSIYLLPSSAVTPDLEASIPSPYNSSGLSTAYGAAAVRVGFFYKNPMTGRYALSALWFPNADVELVNSDGIWQLNSSAQGENPGHGGNTEAYYTLVKTAGVISDATTEKIPVTAAGYLQKDDVNYIWDLQKAWEDKIPIYNALPDECRLVVWVEGTDRECKNALQEGKMKLELVLQQGE